MGLGGRGGLADCGFQILSGLPHFGRQHLRDGKKRIVAFSFICTPDGQSSPSGVLSLAVSVYLYFATNSLNKSTHGIPIDARY